MLNRIYALPLPLTAFGMLFLAAAWAWLARCYAARPAAVQRGWRIGNGVLAALSLGAVLYATLLDRRCGPSSFCGTRRRSRSCTAPC